MYDKLPEEKFPINPHHELPETFADQVGTMYFDGSALRIEFLFAHTEARTQTHQRGGDQPANQHGSGERKQQSHEMF